MGFETQPMHMHGFHAKVIGSDQRAWPWANTPFVTPWGKGDEKQTLTIGSGETYEWLINMGQQSLTVARTRRAPRRATTRTASRWRTPQTSASVIEPEGAPISAGRPSAGPAGLPTAGGQLFPMHNHDDYKATNNGVYPGGMFTMIETTPVASRSHAVAAPFGRAATAP